MSTLFVTERVFHLFDDEPDCIIAEDETVKTTQLLTCEEAEKIVAGNLGIVHNLANKYAYNRNDHDEITSVAYVGYIKAINGFDPRKKVKFVTFAFRCITNEILFYLRNENKEAEKKVNRINLGLWHYGQGYLRENQGQLSGDGTRQRR